MQGKNKTNEFVKEKPVGGILVKNGLIEHNNFQKIGFS
jgi:hypothetical protein